MPFDLHAIRTNIESKGFHSATLAIEHGSAALHALAGELGRPLPARRHAGSADVLSPVERVDAVPNSHSSRYGLGSFPLHTDEATAHRPPRYLILYNLENGHLADTFLLDARTTARNLPVSLIGELYEARFFFRNGPRSFLAPVVNRDRRFIRFDPNLMRPSGPRAARLLGALTESFSQGETIAVRWSPDQFLVIDNHRMLHGRSPVVNCYHAQSRKLLRVLVESDDAAPL